jgi:hypothetical protein
MLLFNLLIIIPIKCVWRTYISLFQFIWLVKFKDFFGWLTFEGITSENKAIFSPHFITLCFRTYVKDHNCCQILFMLEISIFL